ncbi:glycosyltransferase family 2 protein [Neisseriaceae bacterium ESL0693]|nr:glycosyltransferase family 2 protein [Neisseriaceae bacterium ESL0693]
MMHLSILIPVYRVAFYLPALLDVLLPQLTSEVEVIFYDDASPDESVTIIEKARQQWPQHALRLLRGARNIGLTRARAQLLAASQAEYVWYIDSDDRIEPTALSQIMSVLKQSEPDVVLFDYDVFYDGSGQIKQREHLNIAPTNSLAVNTGRLYQMAVLDGKHYFWNKVFRRCVIAHIVAFDIPAYEDIAYTPILLNQCKNYYYLTKTLLHYRIRPDSIAQKMDIQQIYGLQAYTEQADYAFRVARDGKSHAYLLYKVCIYYFRMIKRTTKTSLSLQEKAVLMARLKDLYTHKHQSEWQIMALLCRQAMFGKAIKLFLQKLTA